MLVSTTKSWRKMVESRISRTRPRERARRWARLRFQDRLASTVERLEDRALLAVVLPGYVEQVYVANLPSAPAGFTVDAETRTMYYADFGNTNGALRKIAPEKTVSTVTSDFSPLNRGFYPYFSTDIDYHNGAVYTVLSGGNLHKIDVTNGQTTFLSQFPGFGNESGVDVSLAGNKLYATDGTGNGNSLWAYDLVTQTSQQVTGLPTASAYGLEAGPSGMLYIAGNVSGFYSVNTATGAIAVVSTAESGVGNFAVDPTGAYLFSRVGSTVFRIATADGRREAFVTGLISDSTDDLAFGPSSSGAGSSLYIVSNTSIIEVSGFPADDSSEPDIPEPGEIRGTKYEDLDGDGLRDAGEPGLSDVMVYLDLNNNGERDLGGSAEPDDFANGTELTNAIPGVTLLVAGSNNQPNTFFKVRANTATFRTNSSTGSKVFFEEGVHFWTSGFRFRADFEKPVSNVSLDFISTSVFGQAGTMAAFSAAGNLLATYDTATLSEGKVETMTIGRPEGDIAYVVSYTKIGSFGHLDNLKFGTPEPAAITDANGDYAFTDLPPDEYVVREIVPEGFRQTSPGAKGDFFYAIDANRDELVEIDAATGKVTYIGRHNAGTDLHGLAVTSAGEIYAISGFGSDAFWRLNPETGAATRIGFVGRDVGFGLGYDPATDTIYGVARTGSNNTLVTYNRTTGQVTAIGPGISPNSLSAMSSATFDTAEGRLIAFDNFDDEFYAFDLAGNVTRLSIANPGLQSFGLAYTGSSFVMHQSFDQIGRRLHDVDPDTGARTFLLNTSEVVAVDALEFVDMEPFAHTVTVGAGQVVEGVDFGNQRIGGEPPVADAGGPYTIDEGDSLTLNASASFDPDGDPLTYAWDLDNDGQFDDATGPVPALSWSQLASLGIDDDGTYPIHVQVAESGSGTPGDPRIFTTHSDGTRLGTINTDTGAGVDVGPATTFQTWAAAFDTDGTLYTTINGFSNTQLATFDLATGTATTIGGPLGTQIIALEIAADGTLYGVGYSDTVLYRIDKATGQRTAIGSTGIGATMDLAFDSSGTLWSTVNNGLYTIDTTTGAATFRRTIAGTAGHVMGIMFDRDDTLYATAYIPNSPLYSVNTTTGVATAVGNGTSFFLPHGGDIFIGSGGAGLSATDSTTVTVRNEAPVITGLTFDRTVIDENGTATLTGTFSDPGTADTHTVVIEWGDGNSQTIQLAGQRTFVVTHSYLDDLVGGQSDLYTIDVRVSDDDGGSDTDSTSITVQNVAPQLTQLGLDRDEIDENGSVVLSGSFTDPGTRDSHQVLIDWGDGNTETLDLTGERTFEVAHTYLDDDPSGTPSDAYVINVTVRDDDGGAMSSTPPGVTAPTGTTATSTGTAAVTFTTPSIAFGGGKLHDGNDNFVEDGIYVEGYWDGTFGGGHFHIRSETTGFYESQHDSNQGFFIERVDGKPFDLVSLDYRNRSFSARTIRLGTSPESLTAVATTVVNMSTFQTLAVNGFENVSRVFISSSGGFVDFDNIRIATQTEVSSPTLTVNNVAPAIDNLALDSAGIDENGTAELSGAFTDAGTRDSHTIAIDWGDGSEETILTLSDGERTFATSHQYLDDDPTGTTADDYVIQVRVLDDDTGESSASATVTVNNLAPVIAEAGTSADNIGAAAEGDEISVTASFTDVGTLDTHSVVIDWGDGTTEVGVVTQESGGGSVQAAHSYQQGGVYTITVHVADDDQGAAAATLTAYVTGVGIHDGALQIVGTAGDDHVTVNAFGRGQYKVHADFLLDLGAARDLAGESVELIQAFLGAGDDHFTAAGSMSTPLIVDAGAGDDHVNGGAGRSILIGGSGRDELIGGSDEDILIAGTTSFDGNAAALRSLLAEWTSARTLTERVANLFDGSGSVDRANGSNFLTVAPGGTVTEDADTDALTAGPGVDWYFFDRELDSASHEVDELFANDLDWLLSP